MNLELLFEETARIPKYNGARDELEAVAAGRKPMSYFVFPTTSMETHPAYSEIRQSCDELGLLLVLNRNDAVEVDSRLATTNVFVVTAQEIWRVPAYQMFCAAYEQHKWSDAAERQRSLLLGYSDQDIAEWLEFRRLSEVSWAGRTFYLILSSPHADEIRKFGGRCMPLEVEDVSIPIFFNRKRNSIRKDADQLILGSKTLARVAVQERFFRELFHRKILPGEPDVVSTTLPADKIKKLNASLESNFQFFEAGQWV